MMLKTEWTDSDKRPCISKCQCQW